MPRKTKTTVIEKEVEVDLERDPNVQAFRLSQLEQVVRDGFKEQSEKMDSFMNSFVNKEDLKQAQDAADKEHSFMWGEIKALKNNNTWLLRTFIASVLGGIISIGFVAIQAGVVR